MLRVDNSAITLLANPVVTKTAENGTPQSADTVSVAATMYLHLNEMVPRNKQKRTTSWLAMQLS